MARSTTNTMTPPIAMPWTCEADESRSPSGLQRSHSPTSSGTGAPQRAHGWVGLGRRGAAVGARGERRGHGWCSRTRRWCHGRPSRAATSARRPRPGASTSAVVRASTIAPSAPAACQRAHVSRGARATAIPASASSPSQSPWNPTMTRWSSRRRPRPRATRGRRQVRLEVVVERRPAIADPAGQPGAGRRSRRRR